MHWTKWINQLAARKADEIMVFAWVQICSQINLEIYDMTISLTKAEFCTCRGYVFSLELLGMDDSDLDAGLAAWIVKIRTVIRYYTTPLILVLFALIYLTFWKSLKRAIYCKLPKSIFGIQNQNGFSVAKNFQVLGFRQVVNKVITSKREVHSCLGVGHLVRLKACGRQSPLTDMGVVM